MPNSPDHFQRDAALLVRPGDAAFQEILIQKIRTAMNEQQRICGKSMGLAHALEWVALDLLEKCDALEARIADAEKPCEWTRGEWDDFWSATCGKVAWEFNEGGPVENKVDFCPGCGHPVVVKGGE